MFAVVRTGGKQYRVAPGDKIVVDKLAGEAGARVDLTDVLYGSDGSAPAVAAEIIAQAKADKVIVFKKKRRHNYRRKAGHRQQHTILRIVSVGDATAETRAATTQPVAVGAATAAPVEQATPVAADATAPVAIEVASVSTTPPTGGADDAAQEGIAPAEATAQAPLKAGPTDNAPAATTAAPQE